MTIQDYVAAYALSHDIEPVTADYLDHAVRALDRWHGKPVELADLSDDLANRWITARLGAGKSRKTVRTQRGAILCLWRAAFSDGLVATEPRRVKIVKVPRKNPDAWWPDEVAKLLRAAEDAPGMFPCGAKRCDLLKAMLLVGYYTCLRPGDLRRLEYAEISSDGSVSRTQSKTGLVVTRYLHPDAMDALAAIRGESSMVFPVSASTVKRWWKWLKRQAAVPGSPKWLRRSGATHCEVAERGSAKVALGHLTDGLAYASYVDARQLNARPPTPPRIA